MKARIAAAIEHRYAEAFRFPGDLPRLDALAALNERSVCRRYRADPVPEEVVRLLCATALAAPTKSDLQQATIVRLADPAKRAALEAVADVVACGDEHVEPARVVQALSDRGLRQILCEGGPALFGSFIAADAVDELCLTISPALVGGESVRVSAGPASEAPRPLRLQHLLRSNDLLISRYVRA